MMICTMVVASSIEEKRFTRLFSSNISFALNTLLFVEDEIVKGKTFNFDYWTAFLIRRLLFYHHHHHHHHHSFRLLSLSLFIYIFIKRQTAEEVCWFCCCFIFGSYVRYACRRFVELFIDVIVKAHEGRTKKNDN
jgi:hypothetical protein